MNLSQIQQRYSAEREALGFIMAVKNITNIL